MPHKAHIYLKVSP